jgi:hypothetical protein
MIEVARDKSTWAGASRDNNWCREPAVPISEKNGNRVRLKIAHGQVELAVEIEISHRQAGWFLPRIDED